MIRLGLDTDMEYYNYLKLNPDELNHFLDGFTINYSGFFRNPDVYEELYQILVSCLGQNWTIRDTIKELSIYDKIRQQQKLKVWSCPCATGEEPYSIALMFDQIKRKYGKFPDYTINASDIDKQVLEKAQKGIYRKESLSDMDEYYKSYFKEHSSKEIMKKYAITDDIKHKISFIEEDVTKGHELSIKYDIIFCRYLFIYISRNYREKLVEVLENHLERGGLLILGKTESLFYSKRKVKLFNKNARMYIMKG